MAEMLRYVYRDANGKWCASVPEYMGADKAPTTEVMEPADYVDYQGPYMADMLRRAYISNTNWARFLDSDGNFNLKEHWNDLYDELEKELYDDAFSILERFVDEKGRWHLGGRLQETVSVDMEQLGLWCAHLLKRYLDPLNKDLEKANQNAKEKFLRTELFRKCPSRRQLIDTQNRIDLDSKLDGAWIATACSEPFITNPHPRRPQYSPLLELPVELHREIFNRLDRRALLSLAQTCVVLRYTVFPLILEHVVLNYDYPERNRILKTFAEKLDTSKHTADAIRHLEVYLSRIYGP